MEKNCRDQLLRKIDQHNRNIPRTVFQTRPQQFLYKHQTFGINNESIFGQFSAIGKDSILYYCSSMLVIKSIDKNTSTYLYKEGRLKNVTALCSTVKEFEEKELMIVAGESSNGEGKGCLNIITLNDEKEDWKLLQTSHKGRVQYIEISPGRTKIGCIMVTPQHIHFNLFNAEKHTLLVCATFKSNDIKKFTLDLNNEKSMYVYGEGILKLFEFNTTERSLKDLGMNLLAKENKQTKFIDHLWTCNGSNKQPHSLIMISCSKIFIIKNENIIRVMPVDIEKTKIKSWSSLRLDYTKDVEEERPIVEPQQVRLNEKFELKCLMKDHRHRRVFDESLVLGASNGLLILFDMHSSEMNVFQILQNQQLIFLTSTPHRNIIASVSKDYYEQNLCFNLIRPEMLDSDDLPSKRLFGEGCHFNSVLSLSASCSRQMFATVSADKSIRVWNYSTKQSIIFGNYKQTPICISIHPSGFYLALAFPNQIELYSILSNSLYLLKSIRNLEEIKSIKFSNRGDFLIANETSCLKLYDPFNFRVISMYEMDDGRIPIQQYAIDSNDAKLVAVYQNGSVFCWDIVQGQSSLPYIPAHTEPLGYRSMIFDSGMFLGSNDTKYFSLYKDDCKTLVNQFPVVDCVVTTLLLSKKLSILFVGTSTGMVRLYSWPITEFSCSYQIVENSLNKVRLVLPNCYETTIHNSNITSLGMSEDCKYLFSGLDNGGVLMMQVRGLKTDQERSQNNKDLLMEAKEQRRKIKQTTTSLVLICQTKIRDKNDQVLRMEAQLQRMEELIEKQKIGREKHLKRMENEKIQIYSNIIIKDKQTQSKTMETQKKEIMRLEDDYLITKTIFDEEVNENYLDHEKAKKYEAVRREKVREEIKHIKKQHIKRLDELLDSHRTTLNQFKNQYKIEGETIQKQYSQVLYEGKQNIQLDIVDLEEEQISTNKQKIDHLNKIIRDLRDQNRYYEQSCLAKRRQDEQLQTKFNESLCNQNSCRLKNIKSRQEILKMEHQLNERIGIIRHKEESYKNAKEDQMNLENYKSLIDDRIVQLQDKKKDIIEIISQKDLELQTLFNQLIVATDQNDKKQFENSKRQGYAQHLEANAKRSEIQIFFGMKRLKNYQQFLQNILSSKSSKSNIYTKINQFLSKPLQEDLQMVGYLQKLKLTSKDMKEISKLKEQKGNQQNNTLENEGKVITKKFNLMKFTCKKMKDIHETNITYTLKQNQKLLEECNLLRYENQCYEKEIRKIENYINNTIQERRRKMNRRRSGQKLLEVQSKLKANELSLKQQAFKLEEIRQFISNFRDKEDIQDA